MMHFRQFSPLMTFHVRFCGSAGIPKKEKNIYHEKEELHTYKERKEYLSHHLLYTHTFSLYIYME